MYILGLNAFHWDSSACLFKDGELIAASEEERFNRIKHWSGLPLASIEFCLKSANIVIDDIDHITTGHDPKANVLNKIRYGMSNFISLDFIKRQLHKSNRSIGILESVCKHFNSDFTSIKTKVHQIEHHRSHLASSFFASPFEDAALLSVDAFGDFSSTMRGIGKGNKIEIIDSVSYPHSLGMFYTALTQFLGFHQVGDEYKIMGLAPYGKPIYINQLNKTFRLKKNGLFELDSRYFTYFRKGVIMEMRGNVPYLSTLFSNELIKLLGPARHNETSISQYHMDLAASVQLITEQIIFHIATDLRLKTGLPFLCLSGGVAQNSVANGKIGAICGFSKVYIPSAGHDAGLSIGSALYFYNHILDKPRSNPILSAYTGSIFSNEEIQIELDARAIKYQIIDDSKLYDIIADRISNKGVVGWFTGRAEFGPRALGGRSILADPRNIDAKELLNSKIKRRESFRPFAPSILKEKASEYFDLNDIVPFMEKVFPVKMEKRAIIPAVTHVDGSGRLQTVDKDISPRFYNLINAFYNKTGVPLLLNTSFNENEPIVNSPSEAIECFLRTQMDMLVMENCVIIR